MYRNDHDWLLTVVIKKKIKIWPDWKILMFLLAAVLIVSKWTSLCATVLVCWDLSLWSCPLSVKLSLYNLLTLSTLFSKFSKYEYFYSLKEREQFSFYFYLSLLVWYKFVKYIPIHHCNIANMSPSWDCFWWKMDRLVKYCLVAHARILINLFHV